MATVAYQITPKVMQAFFMASVAFAISQREQASTMYILKGKNLQTT